MRILEDVPEGVPVCREPEHQAAYEEVRCCRQCITDLEQQAVNAAQYLIQLDRSRVTIKTLEAEINRLMTIGRKGAA
jgi:hypothetical protein